MEGSFLGLVLPLPLQLHSGMMYHMKEQWSEQETCMHTIDNQHKWILWKMWIAVNWQLKINGKATLKIQSWPWPQKQQKFKLNIEQCT